MSGPLSVATLACWLLTASIGGYMLRSWITGGGLRHQRATGEGVPPLAVFGHASAALTGLTVWICYLASKWQPLTWTGVALAATAITLGICTVTLWTPYPVHPLPGSPPPAEAPRSRAAAPAAAPPPVSPTAPPPVSPTAAPPPVVTDEMIAELLDDPFPAHRRPRLNLAPLIPAAHGVLALTTFLLATVTAASVIS